MQNLTIEKAELSDLPKMMEIYAYAREFMKKTGNPNQWSDKFPEEAVLRNDIQVGNLYVIKENGAIHAVFALIIGEDPTYAHIEQGAWISDTAYGTIHRLAGDGQVRGIFPAVVEFCSRRIRHLRVDTHENNRVMQHLIEKNGFVPCGIIYLEDGSPRLAYERVCAESSLSVRQQKADKVIRDVAKLCRDFDAKKVILYGSRAKGTARERSDIDIAVSGVESFLFLKMTVISAVLLVSARNIFSLGKKSLGNRNFQKNRKGRRLRILKKTLRSLLLWKSGNAHLRSRKSLRRLRRKF